jgi:hypothetical protein
MAWPVGSLAGRLSQGQPGSSPQIIGGGTLVRRPGLVSGGATAFPAQIITPASSRIFDASVPAFPTAFADVRASSADYFNSSGVLSAAAANAQRIDYDPSTLALRGLLVEPAATNLVTTSDFTAWNQLAIFSVSSVTGLDGASSAYSIVPSNSSGNGHLIYLSASSYTTPDGQTSCLSVYAKSSDFSLVAVRENSGACAVFNVALGTVVGTFSTFPFTVSNPTITAVGGGWYRLSAAFTASGPASTLVTFIPCDGWTSGDPYFVTISPAADNVKSYTLFGPQAELGATSPSSVIVSAGSTTTRAADAYSFTLGANTNQLTFTFDDGSTQTVSGLTGGSTYTIPTNLNRPWILYIDDNSGAVASLNVTYANTLGALVQTATATVIDTAVVAQTLGALGQTAAATVLDKATAAQTLGALTQALTGTVIDTATVSQALGNLGQTATAAVIDTATTAQTLGGLGQTAAGTVTVTATVAQVLGALSQTATAGATATAAAAQILGALGQVAASTAPEAALASQVLGALGQLATAANLGGGRIAVTDQVLGGLQQFVSITPVPQVYPPDPRPSRGLRRIYPAAGVPGVYNADVFGGGASATTPDFSSGDFSGDFARTGRPATSGSGANIYGAAGALNKPLRRTSGPQMRRTYKYPVQLVQGGIYQKDIYGQNIYQSDS